MEVKNEVVLEIKREERLYRMEFPVGAPLGEAYDVCRSFLEKLISSMVEHAEKSKPQPPVEEKKEKTHEQKK
jgi:hypothetical protein